jgi:hypothetical protein
MQRGGEEPLPSGKGCRLKIVFGIHLTVSGLFSLAAGPHEGSNGYAGGFPFWQEPVFQVTIREEKDGLPGNA